MMRQKAYKGTERNADGVLVGKPEGKRPLGRPRYRWEDIIKISLTEVAWKGVNYIHLTQDGQKCQILVNRVMKLQNSHNTGNFFAKLRNY